MRAAAAVGVVFVFIIGSSALSQPDSKGIAVSGPTPQTDPSNDTRQQKAPRENSALPVLVVQSDDDAKRTKQREDDSDERNKADLIAQQAAASAAEAQALVARDSYELSRWALWLSFFSLIGFGINLWYAHRSTRAAIDTIASAERSQRALVLPTFDDDREARVPRQRDGKWQESNLTVFFALENYGKSPAFLREAFVGACVLKADSGVAAVAGHDGQWKLKIFGNAVVRGQAASPPNHIACLVTAEEAISMRSKGADALRLFFAAYVVYDDIFGRRYKRECCVRFYPSGRPQFISNSERELTRSELPAVFRLPGADG